MQEVLIHPPRTLMEVFKTLPEGTLAEVIDNQLYMSPSPIGKHQRILRNLFRSLDKFVMGNQLGEVFFSPYHVFLDEDVNAVRPDLIFVSEANISIVHDDGAIHGVPDMLIEVLSHGNSDHDTIIKKNLYERFGVKEYWIVDPATKSTWGYKLTGSTYQQIKSEAGKINTVLLDHIVEF